MSVWCRTIGCRRSTIRPGNPAKFAYCASCTAKLLRSEPVQPNGRWDPGDRCGKNDKLWVTA